MDPSCPLAFGPAECVNLGRIKLNQEVRGANRSSLLSVVSGQARGTGRLNDRGILPHVLPIFPLRPIFCLWPISHSMLD